MKNIKDPDKKIVRSIQKYECSDCIKELKERHVGLIYNIYSKYGPVLNSFNFQNADFSEEIDNIIFKSAQTFNLKKRNIKFSSFLGNHIRYFCLNKITEFNKKKTIETEPEKMTLLIDECYNNFVNNNTKDREICDYIFEILNDVKDKRIKRIFELRYFNGNKLTFKEIGRELNLTGQSIINLHKKGLMFLKDKLNREYISGNI